MYIYQCVSIPFDQGDVFRQQRYSQYRYWYVSIPFDQGDVFRLIKKLKERGVYGSQSLSIRAMSFDKDIPEDHELAYLSQSLSIRAMSFDQDGGTCFDMLFNVSIPFDQGDVFRQMDEGEVVTFQQVSIPFDQGDVFRLK